MKRKVNFAFLLLSIFFCSCNETSKSIALLAQAQHIMDENPPEALRLLDSIRNPEEMDKENYMMYIVAHVQAKFKNNQDITGDTLILEAQRYFKQKNNAEKSVMAHFCAGYFYSNKELPDKALECFLMSEQKAKETKSNILTGKSLNNIGHTYYTQNMMDSALVHFLEAYNYLNKEENTDLLKLQAFNSIGVSYYLNEQLDEAVTYFNRGLDLSKKIDNRQLQANFTRQLGVAYREKKDFSRSNKLLREALAQSDNSGDSIRAYLNLSKLYNLKHEPDSAKYFTDIIKIRLAEIKDNEILKSTYGSLAEHNKQRGNFKEALYYTELRQELAQKIQQENSALKLLETEKSFQATIQQKELSSLRWRTYLIISISIFVLFVLLYITYNYFRNKNIRLQIAEEVAKNKLLQSENELMAINLQGISFAQNIYVSILTEWVAIDKEVQKLAKEFGTKEDPPIVAKIKTMVGNIKIKVNEQFIEKAKDLLRREPSGEKAIARLNDKDLLFLILCYCKYNTRDTATILGLFPHKPNLDMKRLSLRNKLIEAGLPPVSINQLLHLQGYDALETVSFEELQA